MDRVEKVGSRSVKPAKHDHTNKYFFLASTIEGAAFYAHRHLAYQTLIF